MPEATPRQYNIIEISRKLDSIRVHTREQKTINGAWGGMFIWQNPTEGLSRIPYYDLF